MRLRLRFPDKRLARCLATMSLTLVATLALAQTVTHDYDRAANFSNYHTYAWTHGTELTDEFNHASAVGAIDAALAGKGLTRVESSANPDLLVAYHASFDGKWRTLPPAEGWGPLNVGGRWKSARLQPVLVGTLVVDMLDARSNAIVWWSRASSDVGPGDEPARRQRKIASATEKMFKDYPPSR